jgi:hypothetical protein
MTVRYETLGLRELRDRTANNPHLSQCLEKAVEVRERTGCKNCPRKEVNASVRLALQFTSTPFGDGNKRREAVNPSNIVAVVMCQSAGFSVLVQAMSGPDSRHCVRLRQRSAAA